MSLDPSALRAPEPIPLLTQHGAEDSGALAGVWLAACAERIRQRDASITGQDALEVAKFMHQQIRWRCMPPSAAADAVFDLDLGTQANAARDAVRGNGASAAG